MQKETSNNDKDQSTKKSAERRGSDSQDTGQQRLRLLIVEDYDGFRESLQMYFEYFGYLVEVADCYRAAIKEAERNPPDVVICDWQINGRRDGTEVAREIHTRYGSTIIFLSGASTARLRAATLDLSAAYYFQKPASPGEIAQIIKTVELSLQ